MRVTPASTHRNYLRGIQKNSALVQKYAAQADSGLRFTRMSEDPVNGLKSMQVRRTMTQNETYMDNAKSAQSKLDLAEGNVTRMKTIVDEVYGKALRAANADTEESDRKILMKEIKSLQEEMFSLMNSTSSTGYLFGGTNSVSAPFSVDDDGYLLYNGFDVRNLTDGSNDTQRSGVFDDSAYIDIGWGLDTSNLVNTAFDHSIVGVNIVGYGENNAYNLITDVIKQLEEGALIPEKDNSLPIIDQLKSSSGSIASAQSMLGIKNNTLSACIDLLEGEQLILTERLEQVAYKDSYAALTDYSVQNYIYELSLMMGQKLIQPTLFSFIS